MITIDKYARKPIYEQVVAQFERLILQQVLKADDPLPSVRILSQELSVNPNTLQKAYSELEHSGLTYTVLGNGRYVAPQARSLLLTQKTVLFQELNRLAQELLLSGFALEDIIASIRTLTPVQNKGEIV